MSQEHSDWTPERLLQAWGTSQSGRLQSATLKTGSGGGTSVDDEQQAAFYVSQTPGFDIAEPALCWLYARMQPGETFPVGQPGESFGFALLKRRWGWLLGEVQPHKVCQAVRNRFMDALADRVRQDPFRVIRPVEDEDSREQVEERIASSSREMLPKLIKSC